MSESINESVSVILWNKTPYSFAWHGRKYKISTIGFHHTYRDGRVLVHVFSVTAGDTFFTLVLDTETLEWKLTDMEG